MKKNFILLSFVLVVLVGIFAFSTWTNAQAVGGELSGVMGVASEVSPLALGLLLIVGLALAVKATLD